MGKTRQGGENFGFAAVPGAFNKLHQPSLIAMAQRADNGAEAGAAFPFTISGEHDDNATFFLSTGDGGIDLLFMLLHFLLVAIGIGCLLAVTHTFL